MTDDILDNWPFCDVCGERKLLWVKPNGEHGVFWCSDHDPNPQYVEKAAEAASPEHRSAADSVVPTPEPAP